MNNLTDDELLRHAHADMDDLTSTPLERELLNRFERLLTEADANTPVIEALDDAGLSVETTADLEKLKAALDFADDHDIPQTRALLDVLADHDIHEPAELKGRLAELKKFDDLSNDLAEPLARLQAIFNPATA